MTWIELEHCTDTILEAAMYELGSVELKDVSGWTNPGNLTVTISNNQTTIAIATCAETV